LAKEENYRKPPEHQRPGPPGGDMGVFSGTPLGVCRSPAPPAPDVGGDPPLFRTSHPHPHAPMAPIQDQRQPEPPSRATKLQRNIS